MKDEIFKVKRGFNYFVKFGKGRKPVIVFIHGLGNNCTQWQETQNYFDRKGIETMAIDLLGCGNSDKPMDKHSYEFPKLADDIVEIIENRPVVLVAHSMGALPSLIIAQKHPELVKAMILLEPVYGSLRKTTCFPINKLEPLIDYMLPIVEKHTKKRREKNEPFMPELAHNRIRELIAMLKTSPLAVQMECLKEMMEWKPDFEGISEKIPVLVVGGGKDYIVNEEGLSKLVRKMKSVKYIKLEEAEHTLVIDEPGLISELIEEMYETL